jgi:hypothetical protein
MAVIVRREAVRDVSHPKEHLPSQVASVLSEMVRDSSPDKPRDPAGPGEGTAEAPEEAPSGRFDFDLAEFPLFRFYKNAPGRLDRNPLVYADTIRGRDGERVSREWKAYPGPFGFGGPSTQLLLYDLLQLYAEQGYRGAQLMFGTIRSLLVRRGERNPSKRDYERVRRDMDILRGYDFHCRNAFWDQQRRAYVDMNWRMFGSVFYFKEQAVGGGEELPFGFIEVSPVLQEVARGRGFFPLGFSSEIFYSLRPLEQRLAVYLSKKFVSQQVHRRHVEDLARALPIEAARPRDVRSILRDATQGLLDRGLPTLRSFRLTGPKKGRWVAKFVRGTVPRSKNAVGRGVGASTCVELDGLVEQMIRESDGADDRVWWVQCAIRLGRGPVDRALGLLRDACAAGPVRNRAALLTKILKDIAEEGGVALR